MIILIIALGLICFLFTLRSYITSVKFKEVFKDFLNTFEYKKKHNKLVVFSVLFTFFISSNYMFSDDMLRAFPILVILILFFLGAFALWVIFYLGSSIFGYILLKIGISTNDYIEDRQLLKLTLVTPICMIISLKVFFSIHLMQNNSMYYIVGITKAFVAIVVPFLILVNIILIFSDFIDQYKSSFKIHFGNKVEIIIVWLFSMLFNLFALCYWLVVAIPGSLVNSKGNTIMTLSDTLYFTIVTFFTVGYGDILASNMIGKIIVSAIILCGGCFVIIGLAGLLSKINE